MRPPTFKTTSWISHCDLPRQSNTHSRPLSSIPAEIQCKKLFIELSNVADLYGKLTVSKPVFIAVRSIRLTYAGTIACGALGAGGIHYDWDRCLGLVSGLRYIFSNLKNLSCVVWKEERNGVDKSQVYIPFGLRILSSSLGRISSKENPQLYSYQSTRKIIPRGYLCDVVSSYERWPIRR